MTVHVMTKIGLLCGKPEEQLVDNEFWVGADDGSLTLGHVTCVTCKNSLSAARSSVGSERMATNHEVGSSNLSGRTKKCTHPQFFFMAEQKGIFCPHCRVQWLRKVEYFQGMRYSRLVMKDTNPA